MPFAPKIRKDILNALEKYIIPALRKQCVTQILAEPPFDFDKVDCKITQKQWLEDKDFEPSQVMLIWERERIRASRLLTTMFIYEGIYYEPVGIMKRTAEELSLVHREGYGGINLLTLQSPTVLCFPPNSLRSQSALKRDGMGNALYYLATDTGLRVWLSLQRTSTHNLEIKSIELTQMAQLYLTELRAGEMVGAQALQLALALALHRYLLRHHAPISNSCWVAPPDISPQAVKVLSKANLQLCHDLTEYIINHLHSDLTLEDFSTHFDVSSSHLNAVFKKAHGVTVMSFVTQMRIEAAKTILTDKPEHISDVAGLVGFSSAASFSNVFRRHTGKSPRDYQRENAKFSNRTS